MTSINKSPCANKSNSSASLVRPEAQTRLLGIDTDTGEAAAVVLSDDLVHDLKALFHEVYKVRIGAVKWWCGVPDVDKAVIWQGTPWVGSRKYWLDVSFSDERTW